jgi:hypothetical protein
MCFIRVVYPWEKPELLLKEFYQHTDAEKVRVSAEEPEQEIVISKGRVDRKSV